SLVVDGVPGTVIHRLSLHDALPIYWSPIETGKFIEEQGWDYDGYCWYRRSFHVDPVPKSQRVELLFEAADESVEVWLNGVRAGSDRKSTRLNSSHLGSSYALFAFTK